MADIMAGWRFVGVADALREHEKGQKGQQGKHNTPSFVSLALTLRDAQEALLERRKEDIAVEKAVNKILAWA